MVKYYHFINDLKHTQKQIVFLYKAINYTASLVTYLRTLHDISVYMTTRFKFIYFMHFGKKSIKTKLCFFHILSLTIHSNYFIQCSQHLNTMHTGFIMKQTFYFHKILKFKSLFHKLLNQYQACLYLFECIFNDDSKYSNKMQSF